MSQRYMRAQRELDIKAVITMTDGEQVALTSSDIYSYSSSASIGGEGLSLGGTEAASFNLEIDNVGPVGANGFHTRKYTPNQFDGAEVHVYIADILDTDATPVWEHFGVWYVDNCECPEQSSTMRLSGYDALATLFDKVVSGGTYNNLYALVRMVTPNAIPLARNNFPHASMSLTAVEWDDGTTARDILGYCAALACGFARIERDGKLNIVGFQEGVVNDLDGDLYRSFTPKGGEKFKFNCIEAENAEGADYAVDDDIEYVRFAVNTSIEDNATNTIKLDYNPLLTEARINSIVDGLRGLEFDGFTLDWGGDPTVNIGDNIGVYDLNDNEYYGKITSQSFSFNGGLSVSESSEMPSSNSVSAGSYSTAGSVFDHTGKVRAQYISNLDEETLSITSGYIGNLTSETITTDTLWANIIKALNLTVDRIDAGAIQSGTITADKIDSGAITADKIDSGAITADKIDSGAITADKIHSGAVTADKIDSDSLNARIATAVQANIGTANIGFAQIKDADVETLFTHDGNADKYYIKKLGVTSAQIMNLMVGLLVFRASDGKYYQLDATTAENGSVQFAPVEYTGTIDPDTGVTGDGSRYVYEDTVNTEDLYAANAHIADAIVTRLQATKLFANEAFINKLTTSELFTDGTTLTIMSQKANEAQQSSTEAAAKAEAVESLVNTKASTYYADAAPIGDFATGDIWVRVFDAGTTELYRWDGANWVLLEGKTVADLSLRIADIRATLSKYFVFDDERGLIIKALKPDGTDSPFYTLTSNDGFNVMSTEKAAPLGSFDLDGLSTVGINMSQMRCRPTSKGWAWIKRG